MGVIKNRGFTLIELLVVIAILGVIAAALIAVVNPFEQIKKSIDANTKNAAVEFMDANSRYYATHNNMPWNVSSSCLSEIGSGNTLDNTPSCVSDLIHDGELKQGFSNSTTLLSKIHIDVCNDQPVICFNPLSKSQNNDPNAKYDENGNLKEGCPSSDTSKKCYWCTQSTECQVAQGGGGNDGGLGGGGSLFTPTPTQSQSGQTTPTPTPEVNLGVGPYALDDTKFLRTYAVLSFDYPDFAPNYMIDISFRPDFGGTSRVGFGYYGSTISYPVDVDTIFWVAYAGDGNFFADWAADSVKQHQTSLTSKHFAFISLPYLWTQYVNGCGKTIYWRLSDFRDGGTGYTSTQFSPTYSGTIDCTTKVGVVYNPSSWSDFNHDGVVDYTDYVIGALDTIYRYGGWEPPE